MTVAIYYFKIRGRTEVIKLICAYKGEPFELHVINYADQKQDLESYYFGQSPRVVDGDINLCQSNAIIRHLARKHDLYGANEPEMCQVDMILDGVEDLRLKYVPLIYGETAKSNYFAKHIDKASAIGERNGGAHFEYLARLLRKNGGDFFVGNAPTAADFAVWEVVDLHLRPALFPDQMKEVYPELVAHHARIAALPGVKEYLAGPDRLEQPNNNGMG